MTTVLVIAILTNNSDSFLLYWILKNEVPSIAVPNFLLG